MRNILKPIPAVHCFKVQRVFLLVGYFTSTYALCTQIIGLPELTYIACMDFIGHSLVSPTFLFSLSTVLLHINPWMCVRVQLFPHPISSSIFSTSLQSFLLTKENSRRWMLLRWCRKTRKEHTKPWKKPRTRVIQPASLSGDGYFGCLERRTRRRLIGRTIGSPQSTSKTTSETRPTGDDNEH